jgi:hypothetical protein
MNTKSSISFVVQGRSSNSQGNIKIIDAFFSFSRSLQTPGLDFVIYAPAG